MLVLLFVCAFLNQAFAADIGVVFNETFFNFPSFTAESCKDGRLICTGSVTAADGYLSLTPDVPSLQGNFSLPLNQVGRVLYGQPIVAWPATISTTFTFRIITSPGSPGSGDGLTFIMAPSNSPSPPGSYGSYLGIMDPQHDIEGLAFRQLAVEFDTYKNPHDMDGNHIAIDTRSVTNPVLSKSLSQYGIDLKSGRDIKVRIVYNGRVRMFQVFVGYAAGPLVYFLEYPMDFSVFLPNYVFMGFTASTGFFTERHQLLNWELVSHGET